MISFGNLAPFEYVTCLNHTINLAVLAVVFPKNGKNTFEEFSGESDEEESEHAEKEFYSAEETFSTTIAKMRAIISCFRKSPVKNNLLQAELEKQNHKKLELTLFTKTRWNSLVISGKRFLDLLPAVLATLSELGSMLSWDDENTELLKVSFKILIHHPNNFLSFLDSGRRIRTSIDCNGSSVKRFD